MDKITFEEIEYFGITTTFVVQTHEDGSVTSMSKEYFDTLPSNSSIPQAGE
jgi:hypothetical protein